MSASKLNDILSYKNIMILSGAGVSTNCNIPDYRGSRGIFTLLQGKYGLSEPADLFNKTFLSVLQNDEDYQKYMQNIKEAVPGPSHYLAQFLNELGILRKVYTQNIDGLYHKTSLPADKIVEFHGSIRNNNVIYYNDIINKNILSQVIDDFEGVDLLLIMGSSLQVSPFCALPNMVNKKIPRVVINIAPQDVLSNNWTKHRCYGYYSFNTFLTFRSASGKKRNVTLRPTWSSSNSNKFRNNHLIKSDCDVWSQEIMTQK